MNKLHYLLGQEYADEYHRRCDRWPRWVPTQGDFFRGRKWVSYRTGASAGTK